MVNSLYCRKNDNKIDYYLKNKKNYVCLEYKNDSFFGYFFGVWKEIRCGDIHSIHFMSECKIPIIFKNLESVYINVPMGDDIIYFLNNHEHIKNLTIYNEGNIINENMIDVINQLNLQYIKFENCVFDNTFYKLNTYIKSFEFIQTYLDEDMKNHCKYVNYDLSFLPIQIPNVNYLINKFAQEKNAIKIYM